MSKAPKNIEKIVLGVAVLAAGGLAALGFMKGGAVEEDFPEASAGSGGSKGTAVAGAERVAGTLGSLKADRVWRPAMVEAEKAEGGQRPVNLMVGVDLYARRDSPNEPFDPLTSDDIHPGIPNVWWLKYDVPMVYADSPQRDADGDGFTNLEEFEGKTDPSKSNSHPPLIAKLMYVKDESEPWFVDFGMDSGGEWYPRLKDVANGATINRLSFGEGLKPGDTFFGKDPKADRFKFVEIGEEQRKNPRTNIDETVRFALFEDLKTNKKGLQYRIERGLPQAQLKDFVQWDRTAVLDLQALGLAGQEFKVEERTSFALPPDGEDKKYFLKSVTPEQVEVTWEEDGQEQSVTIPQGGMPAR